jgi:hypothetical protein
MLFKSSKSTAIMVFLSLIFTSLTSFSCGNNEANQKSDESEEAALPAVWYAVVVVSTGLTIRANIRSHSKCMAIKSQIVSEHPQYAGNLKCKSM